jgi:hypothetical protein
MKIAVEGGATDSVGGFVAGSTQCVEAVLLGWLGANGGRNGRRFT